MAGLETPVRRIASNLISSVPGAFLRVDRGSALYVSDAPRRSSQLDGLRRAFGNEGFDSMLKGGLLYTTPRVDWMPRVTGAVHRQEYEDELSRLLNRFSGRDAAGFEYELWIDSLKFAECAKVLPDAFERRIREAAAVCLRTGRGGCSLFHAYMLYKARLS